MQHRPMQRGSGTDGYLELSKKPLQILALLLPMIIAYEVGSARYLSDPASGAMETIRAQSVLVGFFQDFGVAGRYLPALAIVTVLLVWQVLSGERWRVRFWVVPAMIVESAAWTIPLMVLLALLTGAGTGAPPVVPPAVAGAGLESWQAKVTISIGAGLYEEFLFRMIGVVAIHMVLVDLARMKERTGTTLSVLLAAAAFAAFHDLMDAHGRLGVLLGLQLMLAGTYFGFLYVTRGFGVAVAVHSLYDVVVFTVLRG